MLWVVFNLSRGRRHGRLVLETVRGVPIVVFPQVFHPSLFLSTNLVLDALARLRLDTGSSVLDKGTGAGICAILAAMKGAHVTAVDISPIAVRCAILNVILNCQEDRVRVLEGDLFQPIGAQRFDLVIFNPPYYEGEPREWAEHAWRGKNVVRRFLEGLPSHLTKDGRALLSVSTELDLPTVYEGLRAHGFQLREMRKRKLPRETMFVYECALPTVAKNGQIPN